MGLDSRLETALKKREKLNTTIQRLRGRLDVALQEQTDVIEEIKSKNIEPENLEKNISVLEEKYNTLLTKFETDLENIQQLILQHMEISK